MGRQAKERQAELTRRSQKDTADTWAKALETYNGTPAKPEIPMPGEDVGGGPGRGAMPAVEGNPMQAGMILSQNPNTAQFGGPMIAQAMESQKLAKALAAAGYGGTGAQGPATGQSQQVAAPGASGGQPQAGGVPPGVNPLAWALAISKGDTGALAKMVQDAQVKSDTMVANRGYGMGRVVNGQYVPDQASLDQALAMERGKQGIELPYRPPVTMPASGGQNMSVFPSEFPQIQQGQIPPRFGQTGAQPPAQTTPLPQPGMQQPTPIPAQPVQDPLVGGKPLSSYPPEQQAQLRPLVAQELAKGAGANLTPPIPGLGTPGLTQAQPDVINQKTIEHAAIGADKDFQEKVWRPAMDTAQTARRNNAEITALENNPIATQTGWGTPQKAWAADVISGLVPGATPERIKEYASKAQTFQAFIMERNRVLLNEAKGVQTEGDAQRIQQTFAQLKNTPAANAMLLDYSKAVNNLAIKRGDFFAANQERAIQGGNLRSLENDWHKNAPSIWDDTAMQKWKQQTPTARARELNASPLTLKYLDEAAKQK